MTDFKVGDKVEVTRGPAKGHVGTITDHRGSKAIWPWYVEYPKGAYGGSSFGIFNDSELKLVQPKHKFMEGDTVTFCMPDFQGWQGGEGIVRSLPTDARQYYKVEIVTPPPANNAQRPGNKVDVLEEWLAVPPAPKHKFQVGDWVEITGFSKAWDGTVKKIDRLPEGGSAYYRLSDGGAHFSDKYLTAAKAPLKFKVGAIVKSVGFQYAALKNKTLIVDHLNEGESTYPYAVRALGEDYEAGHNFREEELELDDTGLALWEIELLDSSRPSLKAKALADYAVADVKATQAIFDAVKPLKIYLAGPMSGIEHYNFPAFFTAARKLRKAGHTVFNPAENDLATGFNALGMEGHEAADHGFSLRDALKTDLSWICENAEALVLLDGWESSKGVRAEMALAEALGLPKYEMAKLPVEVAK